MEIHDELNDQDRADDATDKKVATIASLVLLGGALIAAPLLHRHRDQIQQTTERATASGRQLVKKITQRLPFVSKRQD